MKHEMVLGLDHINVTAMPGEYENVRWFYGTVLGLREIVRSYPLPESGPLWFTLGNGIELHVDFDGVPHNHNSTRHVALRVRSLEAVTEALRSNGFDIATDGATRTGACRCFCRDPFGNRLEFVEGAPVPSEAAS